MFGNKPVSSWFLSFFPYVLLLLLEEDSRLLLFFLSFFFFWGPVVEVYFLLFFLLFFSFPSTATLSYLLVTFFFLMGFYDSISLISFLTNRLPFCILSHSLTPHEPIHSLFLPPNFFSPHQRKKSKCLLRKSLKMS